MVAFFIVCFVLLLVFCAGLVLFVRLQYEERVKPEFVVEDTHYWNPAERRRSKFGSLLVDEATVDVSVIVPAYNESKRIERMLDEALQFLQSRPAVSFEVLVVDDGSRDDTSELVNRRYVERLGSERVRVLTLSRNCGKGGAVRRGMMQARGRRLLMADADGATQFSDLERLEKVLTRLTANGNRGIAVGSRAHKQEEAVASRSFFRNILMWGFHLVVHMVGVSEIKDTQCGFKLFSREAARALFPRMHLERWAFDVELLWLAQKYGVKMEEVPVNWEEIGGSKLEPIRATIEMAKDMLRMKLAYTFGIWKVWPQ